MVDEKQIPRRVAPRNDIHLPFHGIDGGGSGICAGGVNVLGGVGLCGRRKADPSPHGGSG